MVIETNERKNLSLSVSLTERLGKAIKLLTAIYNFVRNGKISSIKLMKKKKAKVIILRLKSTVCRICRARWILSIPLNAFSIIVSRNKRWNWKEKFVINGNRVMEKLWVDVPFKAFTTRTTHRRTTTQHTSNHLSALIHYWTVHYFCSIAIFSQASGDLQQVHNKYWARRTKAATASSFNSMIFFPIVRRGERAICCCQ